MNTKSFNRICVFGATGFIGSAIAECLERKNVDWIGISRFEHKHPKIVNIKLEQKSKLAEVLTDYPTVINAMGSFKPSDFEQNTKAVFQCFWDNTQLFSQILTESPVKKLIHISSGGAVYGDTNGLPANEKSWLKPISWYGKAKVIEESMLEKAALQSGIQYTCVRVSNPFGNLSFSHHGFIDVLINTHNNGGVFNTFNNPLYSRDFIHCDDMARALVTILMQSQSEQLSVYNLGFGKSHKLWDIVEHVKELVPSFEYQLERLPTEYDVVQSVIDTNKLAQLGIDTNKFKTVEQYLMERL
jgi:UDP-glucose 4-epimerase